MKLKYKKAIILGGSKGIGREITKNLKKLSKITISCSRKDIDTSKIDSVKNFIKKHKSTDILILNSGGPPPIDFRNLDEELWLRYFKQLFLSYCMILQKIKINKGGYIFYISSAIIKEPGSDLILSSSLRLAFSSVLKSLTDRFSKEDVTIINIAPGPFKTQRVKDLVKNLKKYEKNLPLKKIGDPSEIGKFVGFIVQNKIKYITGSTIYFDGNTLKSFN
jgi:3-oxoacyl-[acyl-carrier protein] reductase